MAVVFLQPMPLATVCQQYTLFYMPFEKLIVCGSHVGTHNIHFQKEKRIFGEKMYQQRMHRASLDKPRIILVGICS